MNVNLLIDAIVRQTTVLIAQLATAGGARATLAHTANQVFEDLVRELKDQGLGNKVIADMFGMALRTYHHKLQRLGESSTVRGASLWSAVLAYVEEGGSVLRADVLRRFARDDERLVRSVLADLVDSRLVFRTGRGDSTVYRTPREGDIPESDGDPVRSWINLVWTAVHRFGPLSAPELAEHVAADRRALDSALETLIREGSVSVSGDGELARYQSAHCVLPLGDPAGWEASIFDHYQAMVTALCTKLRIGQLRAELTDVIGGSTYHFDVWPGHPHHDTVSSLLRSFRAQAAELRQKVDSYNESHVAPPEGARRFTTYVGQTVIDPELEGENS